MPASPIALLLSLALLAPPGTSEDERLQAARKDYKEDRFGPAAWAFELLAKDYPENAKYHYFVGLARENAGHDTHAALHLQQFLASDAGTPEEREIAKKRLAAIAKRTTRVRVSLPAGDSAKALQVTYTGPKSPAAVPRLTVPLDALPREGGAHELTLAPGLWDIDAVPRQLGDLYVDTTRIDVQPGEPLKFLKLKTSPVLHELELTLGPPKAVRRGVKVHLRRNETPPEDHSFTTKSDTTVQELLPGTYTYEATARGFRPTQGELHVRQPTFETITLTPKLDPQERRRRLALGLSLAGAGIVTGAVGASLIGISEVKLPNIQSPETGSYATEKSITLRNMGEAGAGLLGATLGLWIGAATSPVPRRSVWQTEIILGVISSIGGAIGYGFSVEQWNDYYKLHLPEIPQKTMGQRYQLLASSAAFGLGLGLLTSGTASALSKRSRKGVHAFLQPSIARERYGATLTVDF